MEVLHPAMTGPNVHPIERWASVLGGAALVISSLRKQPTVTGRALRMTAGAALIGRGVSGKSEMYRMLGMRTAESHAVVPYELGVRARAAVTIRQPREKVFEFLKQFENLPRVTRHLKSVDNLGVGRSRWAADGPAGSRVEWDAEIINEIPNELIAWKSLPGSSVSQAGSIRFKDAPGQRGTEIRVELQYNPPAGVIGAYVAQMFGREPEQEIASDLQRLKQYLECGEIASTENQSRGGAELAKKADQTADDEAIA
jgi:uncharacterized membrane protein